MKPLICWPVIGFELQEVVEVLVNDDDDNDYGGGDSLAVILSLSRVAVV